MEHEHSLQERFETEALPHLRALYGAAYRLTHRAPDAEDLVQETCLRAYRAFDQYTPGTNIRAWLFTILNRARTDSLRRAACRPATVSLLYEPASPGSDARLLAGDLHRALRRLPPGYRTAVRLRDIEGFSSEDVRIEYPFFWHHVLEKALSKKGRKWSGL